MQNLKGLLLQPLVIATRSWNLWQNENCLLVAKATLKNDFAFGDIRSYRKCKISICDISIITCSSFLSCGYVASLS